MEQQKTQRDLPQKTERRETDAQRFRHRESERIDRSLLVQAILSGASMWDMPHETLRDLSQQVGNSGMIALSTMYDGAPALHQAPEPAAQSSVPAFPVPEGLLCETISAPVPAGGSWPSTASDPASLN